jgi:hypothetical protein
MSLEETLREAVDRGIMLFNRESIRHEEAYRSWRVGQTLEPPAHLKIGLTGYITREVLAVLAGHKAEMKAKLNGVREALSRIVAQGSDEDCPCGSGHACAAIADEALAEGATR